MLRVQRSPLVGYLVAIVAVALATALRYPLEPLLGGRNPLFTYYLAVIVVGLLASRRVTVAAAAAGVIIGDYLFVPSTSLLDGSVRLYFGGLLLMLFGLLVAGLSNRLRQARQRLSEEADAHAADVEHEQTRFREIVASIPGI